MGKTLATLIVGLGLLLAAGCGGSKDDNGKGKDAGSGGSGLRRTDTSTLATIVTGDVAKLLDPHATSSGGDAKVLIQCYQTLVNVGPPETGGVVAELAESWEVSDDGMMLTFNLRKGVKFHDGAALDGRAVAMSLHRTMGKEFEGKLAEKQAGPYASQFSLISGFEYGDSTVTLALASPVASMMLQNLSMFSASIISPKLIEATYGMNGSEASNHVMHNASGTGPYKIVNFSPGENSVRLEAVDGTWKVSTPAVRTLIFRHEADPEKRFELAKSGNVEMVDDLPRNRWGELGDRLVSKWSPNICYLGINTGAQDGSGPFVTSDIRVRRAIQLAVDRDELLELYDGTARPTYSMVTQVMAEYDPNYRVPGSEKPRDERLAEARKLVEAAGAAGATVKMYYPRQNRPYLPQSSKIADKLRQQINQTGLTCELVQEEMDILFPGVKNNAYEMVVIGWTTDNGHPDNFYDPLCGGDPSTLKPTDNNVSRHVDPEIIERIISAKSITDATERVDAYREIEKMLQEQVAGYVPLVNTKVAHAYAKHFSGVEVDTLTQYRFHNAKITK